MTAMHTKLWEPSPERIAQANESTPEVRIVALNIAAGQYEKSGNTAKTVALLEKLVAEYPTPVADRIETRQKLADFAARNNSLERVTYWQREIVKADAAAAAAPTHEIPRGEASLRWRRPRAMPSGR
jgi:hypothetical protein